MTPIAGLQEALAALCPSATEPELGNYRVDGLVPGVVAFPRSEEEVSAVVRAAADRGLAVSPRGGGTAMSLGNPPRAADVVLCTTNLNGVREYEPADLVVTVQAGTRLAELQRLLALNGQCLALDPPLPAEATIGGVIAANSSGPLRLRHGTCRDMLIGIRMVNADGTISKGGGKVVKNVTGYDMCKLYTGSLGTLGIIVEASFKLAPLPAVETTVLARFDALPQSWQAASALLAGGFPLRACELLSPETARAITAWDGYTLAVRIGGGPAAVDRQKREVAGLCAGAARVAYINGPSLSELWQAIADFGRRGSGCICRVSVAPSRTGEFLGRLSAGTAFISRALCGVSYVHGAEPAAIRTIASGMEGYAVVEQCAPEMKMGMDVWGPTGADFPIMEALKRQFDPAGMFNPGRFVGGL